MLRKRHDEEEEESFKSLLLQTSREEIKNWCFFLCHSGLRWEEVPFAHMPAIDDSAIRNVLLRVVFVEKLWRRGCDKKGRNIFFCIKLFFMFCSFFYLFFYQKEMLEKLQTQMHTTVINMSRKKNSRNRHTNRKQLINFHHHVIVMLQQRTSSSLASLSRVALRPTL